MVATEIRRQLHGPWRARFPPRNRLETGPTPVSRTKRRSSLGIFRLEYTEALLRHGFRFLDLRLETLSTRHFPMRKEGVPLICKEDATWRSFWISALCFPASRQDRNAAMSSFSDCALSTRPLSLSLFRALDPKTVEGVFFLEYGTDRVSLLLDSGLNLA
jgi:hypothetical protein